MAVIDNHYGMLVTSLGALVLANWGYRIAVKPLEGLGGNEPWALITGSGSGLGRALAFELAGQGFNIVLHGSNAAKLRRVQDSLQATYPSRSIRTLVLDAKICVLLSGSNLAAKLDEVAQSLQDIQLRILINNVGMPQARPEFRPPLDSIDTFTYDELLCNASGNAIFPLLLTRALYPQLVRNQPALIVNMGSFAAMPLPLFPSYGPAKAFTINSSAELRLENMVEARDIEVLGIDVLKFTGSDTIKEELSLLVPNAATYAKAVVRSIGCGYPHVAPYLPHALFFWAFGLLPSWFKERLLVNMMKNMRQEAADNLRTSTSSGDRKKTL